MKKKVVLFLPMLIALLDVVIEFAIPTNEVINIKWCTLFWIFNVDYRRDLSDFGYTGMYK